MIIVLHLLNDNRDGVTGFYWSSECDGCFSSNYMSFSARVLRLLTFSWCSLWPEPFPFFFLNYLIFVHCDDCNPIKTTGYSLTAHSYLKSKFKMVFISAVITCWLRQGCLCFIKTIFQILRNDVIDNINKFWQWLYSSNQLLFSLSGVFILSNDWWENKYPFCPRFCQ
jgi:hypothetical protein